MTKLTPEAAQSAVLDYVRSEFDGGEGYAPSRVQVIGELARRRKTETNAKRNSYKPFEDAIDELVAAGELRKIEDHDWPQAGGDLEPVSA